MIPDPPTPAPDRRTGLELVLALGSGVLLAACQMQALPDSQASELGRSGWLDPLALLGLLPILLALRGASPKRSFLLGVVSGSVYFGLALAWLLVPMTTHAPIPMIVAIPILMLLVSFLSLFWALTFWLCARLRNGLGLSPSWTLPVVWTALLFLRNYLLTGFPWAALGYSQVRSMWLAQLGSIGGIYLVTFAVVWTNASLAHLADRLWARRRPAVLPVAAWAGFMLLAAIWGAIRLAADPAQEGRALTVAVVQGNLDERASLRGWPAQSWVFQRMLDQSREAVAQGARLVVWPEGTLPVPLRRDEKDLAQLAGAPDGIGAALITGALARGWAETGVVKSNSAYLTDEKMAVLARYDKRHLVPFGEYVLLGSVLPWQWFISEQTVFFSPGDSHAPVPTPLARVGMLICYEAIFPEIARESTAGGAQLLVNITNDAWFGRSACPYQHLAMSRMRSIEAGRYQVRAANTGISAFIDSRGRELARLPIGLLDTSQRRLARSQLLDAQHLTAQVHLLDGSTFYCLVGDLFAWMCALGLLIGLGCLFVRRVSPRS